MKRKNLNKVLIVISAILLVFAVISLIWYIRYAILFKPLLNNTKLEQDKDDHNSYSLHFTGESFSNWATLTLSVPSFLSFSGSICISQDLMVDCDDQLDDIKYDIQMVYWPKIKDDNSEIIWQMIEYGSDGELSEKGCTIITDDRLNLIEEIPISDSYLNYEECKDRMQFYYDNYLIGTFGEDYFNK